MTVENIILPDLLKSMRIFNGEVENFRVLQESTSSSRENVHTFLTHHSIVYIASGTLRLASRNSEQIIHEGELCLLSPGIYSSSEFISDRKYSAFILFFNHRTAQCILKYPEVIDKLNKRPKLPFMQNVHVIPNQKIFRGFFESIHLYQQLEKKLKDEILPIKFVELIYLLLDSPHEETVLSFLSEAAVYHEKDK